MSIVFYAPSLSPRSSFIFSPDVVSRVCVEVWPTPCSLVTFHMMEEAPGFSAAELVPGVSTPSPHTPSLSLIASLFSSPLLSSHPALHSFTFSPFCWKDREKHSNMHTLSHMCRHTSVTSAGLQSHNTAPQLLTNTHVDKLTVRFCAFIPSW